MDGERIFRDPALLRAALERVSADRGVVVLANGIFDILHVGHIRYLEGAAALGGVLVVALNDDASARALKGEGRPVVPAEERAEMLAALRVVDFVLIFGGATVDRVIEALRPDVHAKGTDYTVDTVPELGTARSVGTRTVIVGDAKEHSSRDLIERIRKGGGGGC
jgi:D-glycero-beta-D-manno-heptose 1-phosphate adenylyltransferase